tara:strand:+ start:310 stop:411 length:102 start_codon:yes stop_codon:yes gene_type:complete
MSNAIVKTIWACNARIEKLEERISELILELRNK